MSLIDQALKKTQSSLEKQKKRAIPQSELADSFLQPKQSATPQSAPFNQNAEDAFKKKYVSEKYSIVDAINKYKYLFIAIPLIIFIALVITKIHSRAAITQKPLVNSDKKLLINLPSEKKITTPLLATTDHHSVDSHEKIFSNLTATKKTTTTSYFSSIKQRYSDFYGKVFSHASPTSKQNETPLNLTGMLEMNNKRVALINNKLYSTGEMIGDEKIIGIHYNDVLLKNTKTHQTRALSPTLTQ